MPELYHAGPDTMLAVLHRAGGSGLRAVLGHQPGIGAFAARLLPDPPPEPEFAKYPTGATAVIDFDVADWSAVAWSRGRLVDFVVPRALE